MSRQLIVNISTKDIAKTRKFFTELGFSFNEDFSDEKALCMIIGEGSFVMILQEEFFQSFSKPKTICDTSKNAEVLIAISADKKEEVDQMIEKVISLGGKAFGESQDYGFMYGRDFEDLDGHIWEIIWMDMSAASQE